MYSHHRRTVEDLAAHVEADESALALVIVGSVARGDARPDSDVDCYLVVSDTECERRLSTRATTFSADDLCDYPDRRAGGPVVSLAFLHDVAERGSEPARFAFVNAYVAFSRAAGLSDVLARIPIYQEHERVEKLSSFASQLPVHLSYLELGEYSRNPYLLVQPAVELVLFGGRLLLAHNRILYPGRKLFMRELERAPDKPEGITELARDLLMRPSIRLATEFHDRVMQFAEWPVPPEGHWERYRRDRELGWLHGGTALADR
jgi:hypothetical protein